MTAKWSKSACVHCIIYKSTKDDILQRKVLERVRVGRTRRWRLKKNHTSCGRSEFIFSVQNGRHAVLMGARTPGLVAAGRL
jgi:hypothetical protein